MSTNHWLTWDGCALTLDMGGYKRSVYLSGDTPSHLLYRSQKSRFAAIGWLTGHRTYCITTDTSRLAFVIGKVRDFFADIVQVLFGAHVHWTSKVLDLACIAIGVGVGSPFACTAIVAQLYFFQAYRLSPPLKPEQTYPREVAARHIAIGVLSMIPHTAAILGVEFGLNHLMHILYPITDSELPVAEQDIVALMKLPGIGLFFSLYACIGAPLLEEKLFRGWLYNFFLEKTQKAPSAFAQLRSFFSLQRQPSLLHWSRLQTIVKTSIIFGLHHYSPSQGPLNLPIVVVTTLLGVACAILREVTGDLWASTTLHVAHNMLATLQIHNLLPR
jgi:membrane protease YdiL (CAAX protease family)